MKFQFTESVCPGPSTDVRWQTAHINPDTVLAVIPWEDAKDDEWTSSIVFATGFRWMVRAKASEWAALTAMLERVK